MPRKIVNKTPKSSWWAMRGGWRLIVERSFRAFGEPWGTVPWLWVLSWVGIFALGAVGFGLVSGFLEWRVTELPVGIFLKTCVILMLFPGVLEELVFRVWLLPHRKEGVTREVAGRMLGWSVVIFVLWHVVNAWLIFLVARPVFWDWRFLVITAWLGWVCGGVYLRTGTIWAPVMIHWLTVVAWKACFGGPVFFE